MTNTVTIEREYDTCIHVRVDGTRNARSAAGSAVAFARRHYGTGVHRTSSGYSAGGYTYVFCPDDLQPVGTVHEVTTTRNSAWHSRGITGVTTFDNRTDAEACRDRIAARCRPGESVYVRTVTRFARVSD